jgi:hypothetical protein
VSAGHSKFSASSAYRWLTCAGSVKLCERVETKRESASAIEGTLGHEPLEAILKNGPHKLLATEEFLRKKYDIEMVIHASNAAKHIWKIAPKDAEVLSEEKVILAHIDADFGGTFDASIVEHFGTLDIFDYKFGKHIPVEVEANEQMLAYAVGKAHQYDYNFERVRMTIIQPRAHHLQGPIRTWVTPIETLFKWNEIFKAGIKAAKKKNAPLKAGDHCFFCDAKKICPAFKANPDAMKGMRAMFARPRTAEQMKEQNALDFAEPFDCDAPKPRDVKNKRAKSAW